jgi:hypothetical protein
MEEWRAIKDYEGDYEIGNCGTIKSLKFNRIKTINTAIASNGYKMAALYKKGKRKDFCVHILVAIAFNNHTPNRHNIVINHKDNNKLNNCKDNLESISQRENTNKKHLNSSSKYTGVSWSKTREKWIAQIQINGKALNLGGFDSENDAKNAYLNKINEN